MQESFEVLIVGAGQAGIPLAHALAKAGKRVALAERKWLGGSCVNFGCTPTKAAIASARVAHLARRADEFGVRVGRVEVDFAAVLARARGIAEASRHNLERHLREDADPAREPLLIRGEARFLGRSGDGFRLRVGEREVTAGQVVLDTGTRSVVPDIPGLDAVDFLTSENWLERPELPRRLAILGGSYIGLEMGQFYARMGSEVTIVERGAHIAGREDEDVSDALRRLLEAEGIRFRTAATAAAVALHNGGVEITLTLGADSKEERLEASDLFLALGRQPNTDALGLENIGLVVEKDGTLRTDSRLATTIPSLWAAGDIRGGAMFTHTAWDDYRILESQLVGDGERSLERLVPYALFTDPELGRVGLNEREARGQGRPVRVGRFDMKSNGKATELGESGGFIKLVADAEDDHLLGATVLAAQGAELVHLYVTLMNADVPYSVMERAIHIHPTLAEAAQSALGSLG